MQPIPKPVAQLLWLMEKRLEEKPVDRDVAVNILSTAIAYIDSLTNPPHDYDHEHPN